MNAPADLLTPVGWVCTRNGPTEVVFEHEEWPSVVRATKESEDLWRVEMTESAGEAESVRTVGYACTRDRALDALSTSMSAMNRVANRTGVVRTMMTSTLAFYGDAGVRGVAPEWRTADRPFEGQITTETPREAWRDADDSGAGAGAGDPRDADGGADAGSDARTDDGGGADGDGDDGSTPVARDRMAPPGDGA